MINRRLAIQQTALASAVVAASVAVPSLLAQATAAPPGPFTLPALPYAYDALEPHIDALTMQIHHDKHHAAYVANLNKAIIGHPDLAAKPIEELIRDLDTVPEPIRAAVLNQGGGHANHSLFWQMMKPGGGKPSGELSAAIDKSFGSFARFQEKFTDSATKQFGSGWAWLALGPDQTLSVITTPNQQNPFTLGRLGNLPRANYVPLLGIDVWEHAYYLKYQNRRPEYIAAFYNVVNWDFVSERYAKNRA